MTRLIELVYLILRAFLIPIGTKLPNYQIKIRNDSRPAAAAAILMPIFRLYRRPGTNCGAQKHLFVVRNLSNSNSIEQSATLHLLLKLAYFTAINFIHSRLILLLNSVENLDSLGSE